MINAQGGEENTRHDSRSLNSHSNWFRTKQGSNKNHPQIPLKTLFFRDADRRKHECLADNMGRQALSGPYYYSAWSCSRFAFLEFACNRLLSCCISPNIHSAKRLTTHRERSRRR